MVYTYSVIAIYTAFHAFCTAAYYYGWADSDFPMTKPRSVERLRNVQMMACAATLGLVLCAAILLTH